MPTNHENMGERIHAITHHITNSLHLWVKAKVLTTCNTGFEDTFTDTGIFPIQVNSQFLCQLSAIKCKRILRSIFFKSNVRLTQVMVAYPFIIIIFTFSPLADFSIFVPILQAWLFSGWKSSVEYVWGHITFTILLITLTEPDVSHSSDPHG